MLFQRTELKLVDKRNKRIRQIMTDLGYKEYTPMSRHDLEFDFDSLTSSYKDPVTGFNCIRLKYAQTSGAWLETGKKEVLYRFGITDLYHFPHVHLEELLASRNQPCLDINEVLKISKEELEEIAKDYDVEFNKHLFSPGVGSTNEIFTAQTSVNNDNYEDLIDRLTQASNYLKTKLKEK